MIGSHYKSEAARRTALPLTPGHEELASSHSCKLHVRGTIAVDPSQETENVLKQTLFSRAQEGFRSD